MAATPESWRSGSLPKSGTVVVRSGLAWLNESAPIFHAVSTALTRELAARGLTVVARSPSKVEAMPETRLPEAPSPATAAAKPRQPAAGGKPPPLKLRSYQTPARDADLSGSVLAVTPPDVGRALYARSQEQGLPAVRSFTVPGRLPMELTDDATVADYALIVRFAAVRSVALDGREHLLPWSGTLVAAATVRGVGSLGFGNQTPPSGGAAPNTYGTPGGYVRGREGANRDFWHRDNDFFQRDYQFRYGPQPNHATPPTGLSPSRQASPGTGFAVQPGLTPRSGEWHMLVLDLLSLAPMRSGKEPESVWRGVARIPGEAKNLGRELPELAQRLLADPDGS